MATIQEAEQNLSSAEAQLEQEKKAYQQAASKLNEKEYLRQTSGAAGVLERKKYIAQLKEVKEDIGEREQNISTYGKNISVAKAQQAEYNKLVEEQRLREKAYKMWQDRVPYGLIKGSAVYPYLKELYDKYGGAKSYEQKQRYIESRMAELKAGMYDNLTDEQLAKLSSSGKYLPKEVVEKINPQIAAYNARVSTIEPIKVTTQPTGNVIAPATKDQTFQYTEKPSFIEKAKEKGTKVYNFLFRYADYNEPAINQPVKVSDVAATPAYAISKFWNIAGSAVAYDVEQLGLKEKKVTVTNKIPEFIVPLKQSASTEKPMVGYFPGKIESKQYTLISPESIGKGFAVTGTLATYANVPINKWTVLGYDVAAVTGGYDVATRKDATAKEKVFAVAALAGAVAISAKYLTTPEYIKLKAPEPTYKATYKAKPVKVGDELYYQSQFKLTRYTPEQKALVNTPLGRLFFTDKTVTLAAPRVDIVASNKYLLKEGNIAPNPAILRVSKVGAASYRKYFLQGGSQTEINPELFSQLPSNIRSSILKSYGKEVSDLGGNLNFLKVGEGTKQSGGIVVTKEFLRASKRNVVIPSYGRTITRTQTFSTSTPTLETPTYTIFKGSTVANDITLPTVRDIAKKGIIIKDTGVIYKPTDVGGQTFTEFFKSIGSKVKPETVQTTQMDLVKATITKQTTQASQLFTKPQEATYALNKLVSATKTSGVVPLIKVNEEKVATAQVTSQVLSPVQKSEEILRVAPIEILGTDTALANIELSATSTTLSSGSSSRSAQTPIQIPIEVQKPIEEIVSPQTTTITTSTARPQIRTPVIKPATIIGITKTKPKIESKSVVSRLREAFNVVVWKGGKEQVIARNLPKGIATRTGVKNVLSTLRASFKLKPIGQTRQEDIYYEVPKGIFRKSKYDVERFVQLRGTRLSSAGERREIKMFKRRKSSKIKWF